MMRKYLLLVVTVSSLILCLVGCKSKTYSSELLGLQLEVPSNWDVEEPERINAFIITPSRGKDKNSVSISILNYGSIEGELRDAIEAEVNRLQKRWSIDEITILEPFEESNQNGFDVAKITIEAPIQSQIEEGTNNYTSFQPMEVLMLGANDRLISIWFRKNTINPDLNDEGQKIIDSIEVYP